MALQIWLPLDGTLENKGVCQGTFAQTVTDEYVDNGKIGKALSAGTLQMPAFMASKILNNKAFSFCCWVYINAETGDKTNRQMFFGNDSMGENNNRKFSIYQYPTCNDLHLSWMNDEANRNFLGGRWDGVLPSYTWTHVAVTYESPTAKVYINGELLTTVTGTSNSATFNYSTFLFKTAPNHSRYLNDYRLYDTCLSAAEVHEIAQGLVLHYKLDNSGFGQENLTPIGGKYTKDSPWSTTLSRADGNAWVTGSAFEATPGETYTISVECDGTLSSSHKTDGTADPNDKLCAFWLYVCNVDTTKNWQNNGYDNAIILTNSNNNYRKIGNTHVWTYTLSSAQKYISLRTNTYSDGSTNVTVNWWNMKVEKGDKFTPWIPNKSSKLYSVYGLDKKIAIDSSGYDRYGSSPLSEPLYESGTPRFDVAYAFKGNISYRICRVGTTFNYTDDFTYAFWLWPDYHDTGNQQYIFTNGRVDTGGRGYGIKIPNAETLYFWFGNQVNSYTIINNQWVHVAFTKSGNVLKLYKNGELVASPAFTGSLPTYSDSDGLCLGCFRYNDGSYHHIYPSYGKMSDFRIYCTALSDDAIKDLYKTSVKIDKLGKVHAFEMLENTGHKVKKNGQLIDDNFIENGILLNQDNGYTWTPQSRVNSTFQGTIIDYSLVSNLGVPITIIQEADIEWSNMNFTNEGTPSVFIQGTKRNKSDGSFVWAGAGYASGTEYITSYILENPTGSYHMSRTRTIPASWFNTYDGERFGLRCDYSDGTGTITVKNIKVTLASDIAKFNKSYISANQLIER